MRLSCIALPDKAASMQIQKLMEKYSRESGSARALTFPPHFTLWGDFEVSHEKLPQLEGKLSSISTDTLPLRVTLQDYGFYPWRVVYLDIERNEALQKLHELVMNSILKYRTPWVPQTLLDSTHFNGQQMQYIERFGYQFAGKFYSPHFTLASNDMSDDAFQTLVGGLRHKKEKIVVTVATIGLVERDSGNNTLVWTSEVQR